MHITLGLHAKCGKVWWRTAYSMCALWTQRNPGAVGATSRPHAADVDSVKWLAFYIEAMPAAQMKMLGRTGDIAAGRITVVNQRRIRAPEAGARASAQKPEGAEPSLASTSKKPCGRRYERSDGGLTRLRWTLGDSGTRVRETCAAIAGPKFRDAPHASTDQRAGMVMAVARSVVTNC